MGNSYGIESNGDISIVNGSGKASAGTAQGNAWAASRSLWYTNAKITGYYTDQTVTWTTP